MVSREIARTEYKDYPKIEKKMLQCSDAVEVSIKNLQDSLQQLSKVDKSVGWQTLNDSCRVIAEKTTLLLKIVYGAEVKRFFDQAEQAMEHLASAKAQVAV